MASNYIGSRLQMRLIDFVCGALKWEEAAVTHKKKKKSYGEYYDWGEESTEPDEQEPCPVKGKHYGRRIVGPWVLGLYKSSLEVRFLVIPNRSGATLLKVIRNM